MIVIVDFGSQTAHLIGRRIREFGIKVEIVEPEISITDLKQLNPSGIIFSGGPSSVYAKDSPVIAKEIFSLNIPILGICYGQQLIAYLLKGDVKPGKIKEYGPAKIIISKNILFSNIPDNKFEVWMSHGDEVLDIPNGFEIIAKSDNIKVAAMANMQKRIFSLQFHPEVKHTLYGDIILRNFVELICGLTISKIEINVDLLIADIKKTVGNEKVICAVSGGVDSTVAGVLIAKAIGENFYPVYVESGLMRLGTRTEVTDLFTKFTGVKPIIIEAQNIFLKRLEGVNDPEEKRKIIGNLYIELFEAEAKKIANVSFLAQGTIYSDVIESKGTNKSDKIKSHHNVGGLPEKLNFKLLEPLRKFYKDEVRVIGKKLGLPDEAVNKHPFPGPGQAIRIVGAVSKERLDRQQQADQIVLEEIVKANMYDKVFQAFSIMTNTKSTAVKGDQRFFGEVVALRIYDSQDIMTASWSKVPYALLEKISSRIVNEVPQISRVVYDITTKPPATMEWE